MVNYNTAPLTIPAFLDASSCMGMAPLHGMSNGDGLISGSHGNMLGGQNYGFGLLQGELSIPSLESISIEENVQISEDILFGRGTNNHNDHFDKYSNNNHFGHNNHIISSMSTSTDVNNSINSFKKLETVVEVGNNWEVGEDLELGEWVLEDLMRDVAFPFVDYQVQ